MKKLMFVAMFAFATFAFAVDINTADEKELASVKGIGPAKAKAIVEHRKKNGPFKSVDDLTNVKGFDTKSIDNMKGELTAGSGGKKTDPSEASKKAPQPLPGKDPKPGPVEKSGEATSKKADETMSKDAARGYQDKDKK
jgi:competence protein ComEA